jgi:formylglycine-generating enzyme required for sulfatase activity
MMVFLGCEFSVSCFALSGEEVSYGQEIYQALKIFKKLGYNPRSFDGVWGNVAKLALQRYQRDKGLPVFGQKEQPGGRKIMANTWGLYDMPGNVWEWCQGWYGNYPSISVNDPKGQSKDSVRVRRGGSWSYGARYCHSANRSRHP